MAHEEPRWTVRLSGEGGATNEVAVTWIGNATVVIEAEGFRILTDPNFLHAGDHAALGGGLRSRRLREPFVQLDDVLPVDLVVLSHHHGDHWDQVANDGVPKDTPIVTTPHAARKLRRSGFTRTLPLQTWEWVSVERCGRRLSLTSLPGKHAPQPLQVVMPPVMGTLLEVSNGGTPIRVYLSGDTLMHDRLAEIPRRHPEIDLAVVHLGGTKVLGILLTMDGEQGARFLDLVDPDHAIPVHYEEYTVMKSPLAEFMSAVESRRLRTQVHAIERGARFALPLVSSDPSDDRRPDPADP